MPMDTALLDLPYPRADEPATNGAEAIRLLAERLETLLTERLPQTGSTGLLTVGATATDYTVNLTYPRAYPVGVVPAVTATADTATATVALAVDNVTNTGFRLIYRRITGATNIGNVRWIAAVST